VIRARAPRLAWLAPDSPPEAFPPLTQALQEPNGLLAVGGDLSPARLLAGYARGIFPWYSPGQEILWWAPDPREVLRPERFHVSRSLARTLRRGEADAASAERLEVAEDRDFAAVIDACAAPRSADSGTWITPEMRAAYCALHAQGHAHSIEVRRSGELVGGVYGVQLGAVFFGESMFSRAADGSKIALAHLCRTRRAGTIQLIDCQFATPHLRSLGSEALPRSEFAARLRDLVGTPAADRHPVHIA
jgi:leucyl/phenylalanyl-tRNA--protein transferase